MNLKRIDSDVGEMGGRSWLGVSSALALQAFVACVSIVYVSFTDIDWTAYKEQVVQIVEAGERDYAAVRGQTGPLVYPAGHVYVYALLSLLLPSLRSVQWLFALLLLLLSLAALLLARRLSLPWWAPLLLVCSRRVASIFVLRCFNDAPASLLALSALLPLSSSSSVSFFCSTLLLSSAVSIKMSALLYLPGYAVVLLRREGWSRSLLHASLFVALQVLLGLPFLLSHPVSYLSRAFELSRVFEHRWSVNWAFVDPKVFVSREFAVGLLVLHVSLLVLFASRRWGGIVNIVSGRKEETPKTKHRGAVNLPAAVVSDTRVMLESLFIGVCCARTLHYQFYALYSAPLLLLLLHSPHAAYRLPLWILVEVVFNVYPPNAIMSILLQCAHFASLMLIYFDKAADA